MSSRSSRTLVLLLFVAFLMASVAQATPLAAQSADIAVSGSQSIPQQTIKFENERFLTSSLRVADPGDSIVADVSVDPDEVYRVYIYNTEEQVMTQQRETADASVEFDLTDYSSGTYLLTVVQDGTYLAIHPLLVRGYSASTTAPDRAARDESIELQASVEKLRGETLSFVEFVVTNGDERIRVDADRVSDSRYMATADLSELSPGEYQVYATIRGDTEAFGEAEFLGLSEGEPIEITSSESSDGGDSGGAGGDPTTPSDTPTPPPTTSPVEPTSTDSPEPETPRTDTPQTDTPAPGTTAPGAGEVTTSPVTTTTSSEGAITPRQSPTRTTPPTETSERGPGFGPVVAVVALVGSLLLLRRSR